MATEPSITNLTNQLKGMENKLAQSAKSGGGKELKTSAVTHQKYVAALQNFQETLSHQLPNIAALAAYGNPGSLPSATQTKTNLTADAHLAYDTLHNYVNNYLEQVVTTVNAAFGQFESADHTG